MILKDKRVLVTGGTGSIGRALVEKIVSGDHGVPKTLWIFSRDESKQHQMRKDFPQPYINFLIGDIRNYGSVANALVHIDMVFHMAAMKHVPACELYPSEAVMTNVIGAENIVNAIQRNRLAVEVVVGCSTDKACEPVSVMGMTKAIQERIFVNANRPDATRFVVCRFGNVAGTRGSVIPIFREQIAKGGPLMITHPNMTRFIMSPREAARLMIHSCQWAGPGEIWISKMMSCRIFDLAGALMGDKYCQVQYTGIRPGERIHEVIVSKKESQSVFKTGNHFMLSPEMDPKRACAEWEYISNDPDLLYSVTQIKEFLEAEGL